MKILIFGAGGVGSVVGGFLARMGHEVSLLGRAWHLDAVRKDGLTISGIWGDYRIKAFDLYTDPCAISKPDFDLVILTVKAFDTLKASEELPRLMSDRTMLLSLQNGLGNAETLLHKISPEQLLMGRVIFGVEVSPGKVKVTVSADDVAVGALPGASPKLSPERMAATLAHAKIPAKAVPDIFTVIWAKVIYNCALNGLCSIHEIPYGKILENEATLSAMKEVVRECYTVAAKKGVSLEPSTADAYIDLLINRLIPPTAAHLPSMLQDLRKGKPTDIDSLNGAICALGDQLGVATPQNLKIREAIISRTASS